MVPASPPIDVFVSYASADRDRVRVLVAALENLGRRVWWDREILPGRTWDEVIEAALDKARCVVVVWSSAAVASQWVRLEAAVAKERRKLIPLKFEEVIMPLAFRDLQTASLIEWSGDETDLAFGQVAEAIEAFLRPDEAPAQAPEPNLEERVLDAAMPRFVQVRNSVELISMIRCCSSEGLKAILEIEPHPSITADDIVSRPFAVEFPRDSGGQPRPIALTLRVEAPDFEPPFQQKRISVRPQTDSLVCCFLLQPKRAGELLVNLEVRSEEETIAARLIRTNGVEQVEATSGMVLVTLPIAITSRPAQLSSSTVAYGLKPFAPSSGGEFTRIFESPTIAPPPRAPAASEPPATTPGEFTRMFGGGAPAQPPTPARAPAAGGTAYSNAPPMQAPTVPPQPRPASYAPPMPSPAPGRTFPRPLLVLLALIAVLILITVVVSLTTRN